MTLKAYIKKRNGVSLGSSKSLRNSLYRSLGSKNFSTFWNYWNPIFGFYLGKFIFKPLKNIFPVPIALLSTFIFSGLIHDTVTTLVGGEISLLFSIWFLFMGIAVIVTRLLNHNFSTRTWIARAFINLSIISLCLVPAIYFNTFLR